MNASTVYDVAKSLPIAEQKVLYGMLQKEFSLSRKRLAKQKQPILTKDIAFQYLLNNVFNKKP